jgi:hypothetical protein
LKAGEANLFADPARRGGQHVLSPSEHLSLPGLEFLTVPAQGECLGDESDDAFCRFMVDNDEKRGLLTFKKTHQLIAAGPRFLPDIIVFSDCCSVAVRR